MNGNIIKQIFHIMNSFLRVNFLLQTLLIGIGLRMGLDIKPDTGSSRSLGYTDSPQKRVLPHLFVSILRPSAARWGFLEISKHARP